MNTIQAVLFDLDNTLLDRTVTFGKFTRGFISLFLPELEQAQAEGVFVRIIELDQDGYKDKAELFTELLEELPWRKKPEHTELMEYYKREYVNSAVLMTDALQVVHRLREKYKLGLITNGRTDIQYGKLDHLGIRDLFDVIVVSEEAGVKKPDGRIFELALTQLHLQPNQCIYVGDHPVNDVEGASKAGLDAIWFKVNQPWRADLAVRPLYTIERLTDLLKIL